MRAEVELAVGRWLIREGIVSERAVAYALALQARGYHGTPIGEILVELERVEPQVLADALARFAGCGVWDGENFDFEATASLPRPAIIVRKTPSVVHYATTEPYDEELREAARFATGAMSSEPLSATESMLAHARRKHGPIDFGPPRDALDERLSEPIDLSTEAEEAFRTSQAAQRTGEEPPIIRFANLLLIETVWQMPGACLRIELFERTAIRVGSHGIFDESIRMDLPGRTTLFRGVAWRFKQMANVPPGNLPAHGQFQLAMKDRMRSFDVLVEPTTRGLAVVVKRRILAFGESMAEAWIGPELARRIAEVYAARRSDSPSESLLRSALATAEKAGEPARIETLYLSFELATLLDFESREAEARPFFEQARALEQELEVGGRIAGDLQGLEGRLEVADMSRRAALLARAEAMLRAPGNSRWFGGAVSLERIVAERASGNATAARTAALELEREEDAWFGAPTERTFHALALAAQAAADVDDRDGVQNMLARLREIGAALELPETDAECDLIEGRLLALQGRLDEADVRLAKAEAGAEKPRDKAIARAERALVLERLGHIQEARNEAKSALDVLVGTDAFAVRERAALEALMRRAGPYR